MVTMEQLPDAELQNTCKVLVALTELGEPGRIVDLVKVTGLKVGQVRAALWGLRKAGKVRQLTKTEAYPDAKDTRENPVGWWTATPGNDKPQSKKAHRGRAVFGRVDTKRVRERQGTVFHKFGSVIKNRESKVAVLEKLLKMGRLNITDRERDLLHAIRMDYVRDEALTKL